MNDDTALRQVVALFFADRLEVTEGTQPLDFHSGWL